MSSSASATQTSPSGSRGGGVRQQALAVARRRATRRSGWLVPRRAQALHRLAIGLLGEPEQVERGEHARRALGVAGAAVERREQAIRGRVVDVALEHLAQLADRALRIVDGVDLGERDAIARAVGLDVQDAAVRLDRRRTIARREQDARETALQRHGGARPTLRHRGVRGLDQQRLGLALIAGSAARRASTRAGGA